MKLKAYKTGEFHILARPMTNIDYHLQQDECEYEDLEGMEIENGYFIIFDESNFAWYPKAIFERDCKELTP